MDRKKVLEGLALALLITFLGFIMFVKPHLGSPSTAPATAPVVSVVPDSGTTKSAAGAFVNWTSSQLEKSITDLAAKAGLLGNTLTVAPATSAPGDVAVNVKVQSSDPLRVMTFLGEVGKSLYIDGSSQNQLRGSGPLYTVTNLNLAESTTNQITATMLIAVHSAKSTPPASTGTTPAATTPATIPSTTPATTSATTP
jgi:hypothetical protein